MSYGARRVPGLRREELAQLAGVSPTYYTRLEQGQSRNASDEVLEAIARALRLGEDERLHLRNLARPVAATRRSAPRAEQARAGTRQLVHAIPDVAVIALDRRNDVLAWNAVGHALIAGHLDINAPARQADRPNTTRLLFLDPHHRELHSRWDEEARRAVSSLRLVAGQHPEDRQLAELIGELCMNSTEFTKLWSRNSVHNCIYGTKYYHHPSVGPMELAFEVLQLPDGSGQRLLMLTAKPGSPSHAALTLLGGAAFASQPTGIGEPGQRAEMATNN
ncbi:MAG: helix-turn-helix transcriptional regulator [Actinomycetota bacterium]|nr:helix-turn-helix transcriptional regulator [Actinomycetota bacterium]